MVGKVLVRCLYVGVIKVKVSKDIDDIEFV